jgi:hypothetical protein
MLGAVEFLTDIGEDHTIRVPTEVPVGRVRVIVLVEHQGTEGKLSRAEERRRLIEKYRGQISIADDFNEPLPTEVQRYFDGGDDGPLGQVAAPSW